MAKRGHQGANDDAKSCPCGAGNYATCCGPLHEGKTAVDALQLMRARYSAYALGKLDFLHRTWDEASRPGMADLRDDDAGKWLGLEVREHVADGDRATVEFVARYKVGGRAHRLHEISRFERRQSQWFYVGGSFPKE